MLQTYSLIRTFHSVGHGAFYTERLRDNEQSSYVFSIVYDCGCFEAAKYGHCQKDYENHINNLIDKEFEDNSKIDALFISHFHTDHINGIKHLMERCQVNRVFIPKLSCSIIFDALFNGLESDASSLWILDEILADKGMTINGTEVIQVETSEGMLKNLEESLLGINNFGFNGSTSVSKFKWQYIPYYVASDNDAKFISELNKRLSTQLTGDIYEDSITIRNYVFRIGITKCKEIYEHVYGNKHNCYSMALLSTPLLCQGQCSKNCLKIGKNHMMCYSSCLYMGDFEAKEQKKMEALRSYYKQYIDCRHLGIIQVPHHGSESNLNQALYNNPKFCVISAGETDKYNHPDIQVLETIKNNHCVPLLVTEDEKTSQTFKIELSSKTII